VWLEVHNIKTKFLRGTSDEHAWLCAYLAFPDTKARYRRGSYAGKAADDKIRLFNIITSTFPTGFLPTVRRAAEAEGYTVEILDRRVVPAELDPNADLAWLRDYQREAVDAVVERKRGIISAPTGSGKTEIAVGLTRALPCQWLFVVHRTTLTRQALDRYGLRTKLEAGFIGEGMWDVPDDATFVCATFQTLHAGMKRNDPKTMRLLTEWAQGLIIDECFPAGTRIGRIPIEQIAVGDTVLSYDETANTPTVGRVTKTFCRSTSSIIRLRFADGRYLVCTPGHPILTTEGWTSAAYTRGKYVLSICDAQTIPMRSMQCRDLDCNKPQHLRRILQGMQGASKERTAKTGRASVLTLREITSIRRSKRSRPCTQSNNLLLARMLRKGTKRYISTGSTTAQCRGFAAYARTQSHEIQRNPCKGCHYTSRNAVEAQTTRREWSPSTNTTDTTCRSVRLGYRGSSSYKATSRFRVSHMLQNRHCKCRSSCGHRSRRTLPLLAQITRPEKRRNVGLVRVDNIEVFKQGCDDEFECLCPGGIVYNLEVERTQTYIAEGRVVHNCHTLPAQSFLQVAMLTRSAYYRVGVSGTPLDRDDNRSIYAVATLGPVIYRIKADTLIDAGVLARPSIRMVHCTQRSDKPTWQGVYGESIVRSSARNNVIVDCAKVAKKPCLLFVKEISHGKQLEKMLLKAGIRCAFTWGNHSTDYRMSRVRDLVRGAIDVLICSVVFQEGLDVPELESVIVGSGGKCLGPDVLVLRYDGRMIRAADVCVGDFLMGPDSTPRQVLATTTGFGCMYRIVPSKGQSWTCNAAHILTLGRRNSGPAGGTYDTVFDIPIQDYLRRPSRHYQLFTTGVQFASQPELPLDPYFLGVWYGDGTKGLRSVSVTTPDPEIVQMLLEIAKTYRLKLRADRSKSKAAAYHITKARRGGNPATIRNELLEILRTVVGDGKHLPFAYLTSNLSDRLAFLAGLIDTDGSAHHHGYEITQKRKAWSEDICFLARSLGLHATMFEKVVNGSSYWRVFIVGDCRRLPIRISRKKPAPECPKKRGNFIGFRIEEEGIGAYAGFTLDGDGRFLLGDFTVTHNSVIATLQRIGRGMRVAKDKTTFEVFDFWDRGCCRNNKLGQHTGCKWLEKHSQRRVRAYLTEGYQTTELASVSEHVRDDDR